MPLVLLSALLHVTLPVVEWAFWIPDSPIATAGVPAWVLQALAGMVQKGCRQCHCKLLSGKGRLSWSFGGQPGKGCAPLGVTVSHTYWIIIYFL